MNVRNATADTPILQIAFLEEGKTRMAFIAEKSPLLSMSMFASEGFFSPFPKDEEIIKILRKWCDEHRDPEADRQLFIKNKSQISTMDANSLVRSSEGGSYRYSEIEPSLKPPDLGIPATTADGDLFSSASQQGRRVSPSPSSTASQQGRRESRQRGHSVLEKMAAEAEQRAEADKLKKEAKKSMKKIKKSEEQRRRREEKRNVQAAERARAAKRAEAAKPAKAQAAEPAKAQAAEPAKAKAQAAEPAKAQPKALGTAKVQANVSPPPENKAL